MMFTLRQIYSVRHLPQPPFNFFLNPFICGVAWFFANFTNFSPNFVSILSILFFAGSTFFFFKGLFLLGSVFYLVRYILDYVDGKIARLKKKTSKLGMYLDNGSGYIGTTLCAIALVFPLNKTIIFFLIPLVVIMSVVHPLHEIIVRFFLKNIRKREYQEFMCFEDFRTITFIIVPLLTYFLTIETISMLPVLTLTVLLFVVKQFSWFVYYYNEFGDYMK